MGLLSKNDAWIYCTICAVSLPIHDSKNLLILFGCRLGHISDSTVDNLKNKLYNKFDLKEDITWEDSYVIVVVTV